MTMDTVRNKQRPARILLVEDNNGDVVLTRRAFQKSKIPNELFVATNGEDALSMLRKEGVHADLPTPDIILLDLNLPRMSGQEVLRLLKSDSTLQHIPIVILSSSNAEQDVVKSYNLHANGYIVKPVSLERFQEVVEKLEAFWFTVAVMAETSANNRVS